MDVVPIFCRSYQQFSSTSKGLTWMVTVKSRAKKQRRRKLRKAKKFTRGPFWTKTCVYLLLPIGSRVVLYPHPDPRPCSNFYFCSLTAKFSFQGLSVGLKGWQHWLACHINPMLCQPGIRNFYKMYRYLSDEQIVSTPRAFPRPLLFMRARSCFVLQVNAIMTAPDFRMNMHNMMNAGAQ